MKIEIIIHKTEEKRIINLGDRIGRGSNSFVYNIIDEDNCVAKCSKNNKNYVSFNLQYNSFKECETLVDDRIIVPKVYGFGQSEGIGDILLMEKIENLYDISFVINNSFFFGEIIIKKVAEAIAKLHNMGISGYDIEFYWKVDTNQLVLLDIGPQYTFDCSCEHMICKHLELESKNRMGVWNIVSQIIPKEEAKKYFNSIDEFDLDSLEQFMQDNAMSIHISNVAKIHALSIISKLTLQKQEYYLNIFMKEYRKTRKNFSIDSANYLTAFKRAIKNRIMFAEANLYYSSVETLCKESCTIQLER